MCRSTLTGDEVRLVIDEVVVHPNFTDYQNDLGDKHLLSTWDSIESFFFSVNRTNSTTITR